MNSNSGLFGVGAVIAIAFRIGVLVAICLFILQVFSNPEMMGEFVGRIVSGFNSVVK